MYQQLIRRYGKLAAKSGNNMSLGVGKDWMINLQGNQFARMDFLCHLKLRQQTDTKTGFHEMFQD